MRAAPGPIALEICVDQADHARAAWEAGADRLELCAALDQDGLTPGPALLHEVVAHSPVPVFAMVRPVPSDFVLQAGELEAMRRDRDRVLEAGVSGIVLGFLTARGEIPDQELGALLDGLPAGFPVTFHRAFDHCADPGRSWQRLAKLPVTRVLTSGRPGQVVDHLPLLGALLEQAGTAGPRLLPGGGVRPHNADQILAALPVDELHSAAITGWTAWRQRRRPS